MFHKYIKFPAFLVSLALGLLYVYLSNPESDEVVVYPTPDNVQSVEYKDKASNCFMFSAEEVACPTNKSKIKSIPAQV